MRKKIMFHSAVVYITFLQELRAWKIPMRLYTEQGADKMVIALDNRVMDVLTESFPAKWYDLVDDSAPRFKPEKEKVW